MARYNKIRKMDISNGEGCRVSIFFQGCHFHCEGCFNPETHDFNGGQEYTWQTEEVILNLCSKDWVQGLSILGGEPLAKENINVVNLLLNDFKERFPEKTIWLWTGYEWEEVKEKFPFILENLDVIVTGKFIQSLHNPTLKWKGSSNQKVIKLKEGKFYEEIN